MHMLEFINTIFSNYIIYITINITVLILAQNEYY